MLRSAPTARAERRAFAIGIASAVAGAALTLVPGRAGRSICIADRRTARLVGVADLLLVPGLIAGRPRWPWLAARATLNLPIVALSLWNGGAAATRRARVAAGVLITASIGDAWIIRSMTAPQPVQEQ